MENYHEFRKTALAKERDAQLKALKEASEQEMAKLKKDLEEDLSQFITLHEEAKNTLLANQRAEREAAEKALL
jgi:predicted metal-binding transcription factor (methanogenesis marker protein 9)